MNNAYPWSVQEIIDIFLAHRGENFVWKWGMYYEKRAWFAEL